METPPNGNVVERTLALFDRLEALYRELTPLEARYRAWAREFQESGVPHDPDEFRALIERVQGLRHQIVDARAALKALAAIGGAR